MVGSTAFRACVVVHTLGTTVLKKAIVGKRIFRPRRNSRGIGRFVRPAALFWMSVFIGLTIACQDERDGAVSQRRSLDASPTRVRLLQPLPASEAEAFFRLETGADQMTQTRKEAGLMVVVRHGDNEYRQVISSCPDPGLGSALGGGTETELEVAICDGEYWLISHPGFVTVLRVEKTSGAQEIARFSLPPGVRAALPKER